jgi:hypothetical protein
VHLCKQRLDVAGRRVCTQPLEWRGIAVTNFGFASVLLIQPSIVIRRGEYMHVGPQVAGAITQFNVTADPRSGVSTYKFRTYLGASH